MRKPGLEPLSIPPKVPSLVSGSEPHTGQCPWVEEPTTRRPHPGAGHNAGRQSHATAACCVAVQNLRGSCQKHPHMGEDLKDNADTPTRLEQRRGELGCRPPKPSQSEQTRQPNGAVAHASHATLCQPLRERSRSRTRSARGEEPGSLYITRFCFCLIP